MDLRAGTSATERRTRSRSLRGPILAGPASSCTDDDDRLRFPPISPPQNRKAGKKESTGHRQSRRCQPCVRRFSNSSLAHRRSDARTAKNGLATSSGVSKSAKVVLDTMPPHTARNWLKTFRHFIRWCEQRKLVRNDPTWGIRLKTPKSHGHHTWSEDEIAAFEAQHPIGSKARLALALGLFTAQR